jgi:hypothetical protein
MALSLHDEEILRRRVYGLVDDDLLAEHREHPFGPHSPTLIEVLDFLRRNPDPEMPRYLVLDDGQGFEVGLRSAERGAPPSSAGEERFATRAEAEHAVFLRRLADYGALADPPAGRGALVADIATSAPRPLGDSNPPEPDGGGAE